MRSRRHVLSCLASIMLVGTAVLAPPATAAPWVRGYVIGYYHPAFYFGGRAEYQKTGELDPGADCPKGAINPEEDLPYRALFSSTPWRTAHEVDVLVDPPGRGTVRDYLDIKHELQENEMAYRGFKKNINTYTNPFAAPDPGMREVTGKISYGFNLDGNSKTGGFTSPSGERGIDNAFYRAFGCNQSFRGKPLGNNNENNSAALSQRANDGMLEGQYTIVVRVSGNESPENDRNATVEIGYSPDQIMRDAQSNLAHGYSYRIDNKNIYSKLKATVKDGVVESEQSPSLVIPKFGRPPVDVAYLTKARVRLKMGTDGKLEGLIGGYEDWRYLYWDITQEQGGASQETLMKQNNVGMYYALKRNADGMPDPITKQNNGISIAWRINGESAFVVDPTQPVEFRIANRALQYEPFRKGYAVFLKSQKTKAILGVVPHARDIRNLDPLISQYPDAAELKVQINRPTVIPDETLKKIIEEETPNISDPSWPLSAPSPDQGTQQKRVDAASPAKMASSAD